MILELKFGKKFEFFLLFKGFCCLIFVRSEFYKCINFFNFEYLSRLAHVIKIKENMTVVFLTESLRF